jgi:hypothetical protein
MRIRTTDGYVNEHDLIKFREMEKYHVDVNTMEGIVLRKMVKIDVRDRKMFADIVTGTLYDCKTGKSRSTKLWVEKVYKNV